MDLKATPLTQETAIDDLCGGCCFATRCSYCIAGRDPVIQCSGFARTQQSGVARAFEPGRSAVAGLCSNCALRLTCLKDKPATGVWHCEDYC